MTFVRDGIVYHSFEEYDLDQYLYSQERKQREIKLKSDTKRYIQSQKDKGTLHYKP